ncbi:meiotically up-regulated gene family-domain-containing protein [Favolaschia claudopus]|uniref:Meiotically up-regulated gene family-domain-containing protein n=1 Tax=Favolaschia claudopus TaxID=2862362 RepID=A0AAW0BFI4_9AGAR
MFYSGLLLIAASLTCVTAAVPYYDPRTNGGSMLTFQNEPINMIVSALSSPEALTDRGLVNWGNAIGYADDCLGIHLGGPQAANLGDGNNWVNQTQMMREDFGLPIGTCLETLIGGNHYRVFRQNGASANSGALFLAASKEDPITKQHNIVPDGYNLGRDQVVSAATSGVKSFSGVDYTTTVEYVSGLLPVGSQGINHDIAIDGKVAVMTIKASSVNSGINCKGSSLCGSLNAASCDAAAAKIVNTQIYRTDVNAAATGTCSGHCGLFVQGTNCRYDGYTMLDAYKEIRAGNCQKCGSKRYLDGCEITVNYVSSC